jgi:hypothetical protein
VGLLRVAGLKEGTTMDFMDTRTKHALLLFVVLCAITAFILIASYRDPPTPEKPPAAEQPGREPVEVMADNFHRFFGKLILLFGEVSTETILRRITLKVGDDDRQLRVLMGYLGIFVKTSSQRGAVLDVIAGLGKAPILDESRGE